MSWIRRQAQKVLVVAVSVLLGVSPIPSSLALAQEANAVSASGGAESVGAYGLPDEVVLVAAADDTGEKKGDVTIGADKPSRTNNSLPILKNSAFEFVQAVFPAYSWKDDDGADIISIGIEKKSKALWKDITNKKTTVWDSASRAHNAKSKSGKGKFKAYFTANALCKSKADATWGEAAVLLGMDGKAEGQYYIFTGEASFSGTLGARVPFTFTTQNGANFGASLILHGSFTPKIAGGLGVKRIGRLGVYGTGTLEGEGQVLPRDAADWNYLRLKAAIGIELVVIRWRPFHKDLWKTDNPVDLITPRGLKAQSEPEIQGPYLEAQDDSDIEYVPIIAQTVSGDWFGTKDVWCDYPYVPDGGEAEWDEGETYDQSPMTAEMSTPQRGMRLLQRNVYPDAQVDLVSVPGGAVMCWLESTGEDTNQMNNTRLMWSRYDAATDTWSESQRVCAEETADFEPDLFADAAGNVHVVWLNAESAIPENASKLQDATELLNVSYARLGAGETKFSTPECVVAADAKSPYFRTSPEVAAEGGNVVVGWSTTHVDHLLDFSGDHGVAICTGTPKADGTHDWSLKTVPYTSDYEITSLDAGKVGTQPSVAWTFDDLSCEEDGSVVSGPHAPTLELVTFDGGERKFQNAEHADYAQEGTAGVLTWSEPAADDTVNLCALNSATGSPRLLMAGASLPPNYQVDGDLSRESLITYPQWESGETSEESTTDVYGRVLTAGTQMSDEALLVAHADDLTSHDVAYVNGEPIVACAAERGVGDERATDGLRAQSEDVRSADLLVARTDSLERLEVIDLLYDPDQVKPGASVNMLVRVSNEGLATIKEGACAQIIDDTTGTDLGSGTYGQPINVGTDVDIPVTVKVPSDFDPRSSHELSVKANFLGVRAEDSYALNLDTFLVGPDYDPDYDSDHDPDYDPGVPYAPATPAVPSGWQGGSNVSGRGSWSYSSGSTYTDDGTSADSSAAGRVVRRSGATRYDTMAQTVSSTFDSSDWAVVASGEGYADALVALSLAGAHNAPVILTTRDALSSQARTELTRLGCKHVVVAGGPTAVSDAVVGEISAIAGDVVRVAGADRYETSIELMRATRAVDATADTVFVATGTGFADALSAGPVSWKLRAPVLLATAQGTLSEAGVAAIKADAGLRRIVLLGGTNVVSDALASQLGDAYEYERLGGGDRYETSGIIAGWSASHGLGWTQPYVATGRNFADALAGAACAGRQSSCMLLADDSSTTAIARLKENAQVVRSVTILGGTQAVSKSLEDQVLDAIG